MDYAFKADKPQAVSLRSAFKSSRWKDKNHSKEVDLMGLKIAQEIPDVKLYCISEEGILKDYLPLSDIHNDHPMEAENKAQDAIKDFLRVPDYVLGGSIARLSRFLGISAEYEMLKETIYGKFFLHTYDTIKILIRMIIKIFKRPFL